MQDRRALPALMRILDDLKEHMMVQHKAAEARQSVAKKLNLYFANISMIQCKRFLNHVKLPWIY
ncbi:MAG: hypothetical protein QF707_08125 [Candidatus Poseidoniaceae archaeon]|nr:hypothetical protein [Candidatus Poseidoniaceae archaeon]MDP7312618.1 hypothetical protein [Candidatus Thalassarchaeaceae archaeon]